MYRFLVSAFAGVFVYVVIAITGGNNGYFASRQLLEQKRVLSAQAVKIQNINDALQLECTALEKDPDVISAYARKLGYVRDGEKLVKITGLKSLGEKVYDTGTVVRYTESYALPEWFCKICGLLVCGAVYFMMYLNSLKDKRVTKRAAVKEVPIYDLPQI